MDGVEWCKKHAEELTAAGWTERELFSPRWPLGLAHLRVWDRATVRLDRGRVIFAITKPDGAVVEQIGRPGGTRRWTAITE